MFRSNTLAEGLRMRNDRGRQARCRPARRLVAAWLGLGMLSAGALGQVSATWTGLGATPNWSDPLNWSSFPNVPGGGGEVVFNGPNRSETSASLSTGVTLSRIANSGTLAFHFGGGSITLVGDAELAYDSGPVGSATFFQWNNIIYTPIHGSAGVTKTGNGRLQLAGANTYTGGTRVLGGYLSVVSSDSALGAPGGSITLDGGGLYTDRDLTARTIMVGAGGGTIHTGLFSAQAILGATSGPGPLTLDTDSRIGTSSSIVLRGDAAHTGTTRVVGRLVQLLPSTTPGGHGRLSGTQRIEVSTQLQLGDGTTTLPSDVLNDAATLSLRGGLVTSNATSGPAEEVGALHLGLGRGATTGSFTAGQVTRSPGATWRIIGASEPALTIAPAMVGSGAPGTPSVAVLPYAARFDNSGSGRALPVTVENGRARVLVVSEQATLAQLPSPDSPNINLRPIPGEQTSSPISVRSLKLDLGDMVSPTITINGGGVYLPNNGTLSMALNFTNGEGFIHGNENSGSPIRVAGKISGTHGLTTAGWLSLTGLSDYSGPTYVNGGVETRGTVLVGAPSPLGVDTSAVVICGTSGTPAAMRINAGTLLTARFERDLSFVADGRYPAEMTFASDNSGSSISVEGKIALDGLLRLFQGIGRPATSVSGTISGSGGIIVDTNTTITLSGNSSYTGGTEVIGRLRIGSDSALGTGRLLLSNLSASVIGLEAVGGPRTLMNRVVNSSQAGFEFSGTHPLTFAGQFMSNSAASINLAAAAPLTFAGGANNSTITLAGTGTLQLAWYRGRGLDARNTTRINFLPGQNAVSSRLDALVIASSARVDIADHDLVIDAGGGTATGGEAGVRALLADGRLISSLAGSSLAVGYARAGDVLGVDPSGPAGLFAGQGVRATDVLLRLTLAGDADLDRDVDVDDFGRLASNFNSAGFWSAGDFDHNGTTNIDDFGRLAANFNRVFPAEGVSPRGGIPEPAAGAIAGAILGTFACRRR